MPDDDYSPLVRAVTAFDSNTVKARQLVYGTARDALVNQARAVQPALRKADLTKERLKLDRETEELESRAPRKASYAWLGTSRPCWPIPRFGTHGAGASSERIGNADKTGRARKNEAMNLPAIRTSQPWRLRCGRDHAVRGACKIWPFELARISSL